MDLNRILSTAALLTALAGAAAAADLNVKTENGIRYVSGGVGQAEQAAIKEAARDYSLNLLFTGAKGRYMAGVRTTIKKGAGGDVLSTVSDGPVLLVDLPPGRYTVEAAAEGKTLTRKLNITKGKPQKVVLRWPLKPEPDTARGKSQP